MTSSQYRTEGVAMRGKKKQSARKHRKAMSSIPSATSAVSKWRLVEQVVASMHESEGVVVQPNVRLPPASGGGSIKREIDVLITWNIPGSPVRAAIECKDYKRLIGVNEIDAFAGKLPYVGIPTQQGIYVTTSGYTQGAIEHARDAGIRLLTLRDLMRELPEAVARAFQSSLYLLARVEGVAGSAELDSVPLTEAEMWVVFDEQGHLWGTIPDVIWQGWHAGNIPAVMGTYSVPLVLPPGCYQLSNAKPVTGRSLIATVHVMGCLVTLSGTVTAHRLTDAADQMPTKQRVTARFSLNAASAKLPVVTVHSEAELQELLASHQEMVQIATRVKLPRMLMQSTYWPPSQRAAEITAERVRAFEAGEAPDPRTLTLADIEGEDLSVVFEPIMESHPAAALFARHSVDESDRHQGT